MTMTGNEATKWSAYSGHHHLALTVYVAHLCLHAQ